jgi:hypothetical protein
MTRVATDDNEEILIDAAANSSASHVEKLVRKYRQVDEDQNPIEPKDEYQQRKLTAYQNKDGMWIINAKLPQLEGGLVVKALEEIMRQQDRNSSAEDSKKAQKNSSVKRKRTLYLLCLNILSLQRQLMMKMAVFRHWQVMSAVRWYYT